MKLLLAHLYGRNSLRRIAWAAVAVTVLLVALAAWHARDQASSRKAPEVRVEVVEVVNFDARPSQWIYRPLADAEVMAAWMGLVPRERRNVTQGRDCVVKLFARTSSAGTAVFSGWTAQPGTSIGDGLTAAYVPGYEEVLPLERDGDRFSPR